MCVSVRGCQSECVTLGNSKHSAQCARHNRGVNFTSCWVCMLGVVNASETSASVPPLRSAFGLKRLSQMQLRTVRVLGLGR